MKRSLLAAAAVLALGSASVYAETPGFPQPSFNDAPDLTATPAAPITGAQTMQHQFPKSSMNGGGGPTGPATVIVQGKDRVGAQYAHTNASSSTRSDARNGDEGSPTLNDTFNYPAY
jgi:hypothetical protein